MTHAISISYFTRTIDSPLGALSLYATRDALAGVYFAEHQPPPPPALAAAAGAARHAVLDQAAAELAEYFAGRRRTFTVALAPRGTRFQEDVWDALARIPFGATWSYGEVARAIGKPAAARAVGAANARNPLSIIVPCHRVIGARGDTVGYAGGAGAKEWLLAHEAR